jgi:hypothetical protein
MSPEQAMMRVFRRGSPFVLALSLAAAPGADSRAQDMPAEGIPVGPWLVSPLVAAQWGYDSNPFYSRESSGAVSEASQRYSLGLAAALPFRSSALRVGYRRDLLRFQRTVLTADTVDDVDAELDLRFASSDRVGLKTAWTEGVADTLRFDPGGETVFRGAPYRLREISATAARDVAGARGYEVRWTRRDLVFPREDVTIDYFEYRGWDLDAGYRVPFGRTISGTVSYGGRRYQHFCNTVEPSGAACPPLGTPFREESGDSILVGLRGAVSERSPYSVRAGWLDLGYRGSIEKGYRGPVGDASIRVGLSANAWVEANLTRQAYSSFFLNNNYFTYAAVQAKVGANFSDRWEIAVGGLYSRSRYGVPDAEGRVRRDDTFRAEAYANLFLPRRFGLRFTVTDDRRDSTIDGFGFDRRTFFVGAFFGWP